MIGSARNLNDSCGGTKNVVVWFTDFGEAESAGLRNECQLMGNKRVCLGQSPRDSVQVPLGGDGLRPPLHSQSNSAVTLFSHLV